MISSVLSKNKDVAAIVPSKNLDGNSLHKMTMAVLHRLHKTGFKVLIILADNGSVNRAFFNVFCGGNVKSHIDNPFEPNSPLFLAYDTVHLFKNIRNNWLNQSDFDKSFIFTDFQFSEESGGAA